MLACWVEDPNGDYFKKHLARMKEFIWIAEDGIKMHVSTHVSVKKLWNILLISCRLKFKFILNNQ